MTVIGVDGGGTKTAIVAVDVTDGCVVARSRCGSLHVPSIGEDAAVANLRDGLEGLGLDPSSRILAIAIGDPFIDEGMPQTGEGSLAAAVSNAGIVPAGARLFVKGDAFMALYALSRGDPAALVVAGTGSMGIAIAAGGGRAPIVAGGWCGPIPDTGSGHAIGAHGVAAALAAFDGTGPDTALSQSLLAFFGTVEPRALAALLATTPRARIASFSREVSAAADAGDSVAGAILDDAGKSLARLAVALLDKAGPGVRTVGVAGGILTGCRRVRAVFDATLAAARPGVEIRVPEHPPEIGAALFAADAMGVHLEIVK